MAYSALEKMRKRNEEEFGKDVGPLQPTLFPGADRGNDMKSAALRFLHERCEDLRFSEEMETRENSSSCYCGASIAQNQIPYNMQMDIDRLCLERELERFIDSGRMEDAYTVYYCYMEMYFGHYRKSKEMVELLSEFESNGSSLLMKHRDHYSHSVYVFALGLAIYETNENFREAFNRFYRFDSDGSDQAQSHAAAGFFLEYWGLTALFHDIGYPFELPFEQVMSYYEVNHRKRGENNLLIAYRNVEALTALQESGIQCFEKLYGRTFHTISELLAYDITQKLGSAYGFSEGYLMSVLEKKPIAPELFGYYMDHAFFSSFWLYEELVNTYGDQLNKTHVDVLSAILLHNSLYKFSIAFYKDDTKNKPPLPMRLHPLAWLLMLCDELQCWDRKAYGRNTRTELHPMAVDFDFGNNSIFAKYIYDADENQKIRQYQKEYLAWKTTGCEGDEPRLKAYSDMAEENNRFVRDIERIVETDGIPLNVICETAKADRQSKHVNLSSSNFLHIYEFAVALYARYNHEGHEDEVEAEQLEEEYNNLSLEYKLSNINQVKSFSDYLDVIRCFYTDRPVDFEILNAFTKEQINKFAPLEHERWVRQHQTMGWQKGNEYEKVRIPRGVDRDVYQKMLREQMRCHKMCMDGHLTGARIRDHYERLSESEKSKDWKPFNSMLKLIRKFEGLRIYELPETEKPSGSLSAMIPGRSRTRTASEKSGKTVTEQKE